MKKWAPTALIAIIMMFVPGCTATSTTTDCPPPRKPETVPPAAVWKGDCSGGHWIAFVAAEGEKIRFRIYEERKGALLLDADFERRDCRSFRLTEANWVNRIAYFSSALAIYDTLNPEYGPRCRLEPVYPAYP